MNTNKKIAIGLGVAGGALLAAWLLTGSRKKVTKKLVSKGADQLKKAISKKTEAEEHDVIYV